MSRSLTTEVNYWPGYVDALVNVVLNLLFLTGVFTIGLVTLNYEALLTQQKMNQLKIEIINNIRNEAQKQIKAKEFINALPKLKEPISYESKNLGLPQIRVIRVTSTPVTGSPNISKTELTSSLEFKKPKNLSNSIEKLVQTMFEGSSVQKINFEINQYAFGPEWKVPISVQERVDAENFWLLVAFCDTSNSRLTKESFARLVFVNKSMIAAGISPNQIQVRVVPESEEMNNHSEIERAVFLIKKKF
jgi:hypothetical protein